MIKLIGIILIFTSSVLTSRNLSYKIKKRLKDLKEFKVILNDFISAIDMGMYELPTLCKYQENKNTSFKKCFININKLIKEKRPMTFYEIFASSFNSDDFYFLKNQQQAILEFGQALEVTDRDMLINNLKILDKEVDKLIKEAEEEKNKKAVLIEKLGLLLGCFLVILVL